MSGAAWLERWGGGAKRTMETNDCLYARGAPVTRTLVESSSPNRPSSGAADFARLIVLKILPIRVAFVPLAVQRIARASQARLTLQAYA